MIQRISGCVFAAVAALHLLRAVKGWDLLINGWNLPIWGSWAAVVVLGFLARANLCPS